MRADPEARTVHRILETQHVFAVGVLVVLVLGLSTLARAGPTDGLSPQAISLPSGPGSIEGLGESFEPQLNTGTATYSVALVVPPGRVGVQPSLTLAYNGGAGNGILGIGWSLSGLDAIHRQTDKGLPRYDESASFSGTDVFVTMGGEELVRLSDGTFRAENEGGFRRYSYDLAQNEWLCEEPDGTKRRFGEAASARIENGGRTFGWYLTSLEDTHGNRIEYSYRSFADSPGQIYPDRIFYTRHASQSLTGEHVVVFGYEAATRPDRVRDFRPGFEVTTGRRLVRIDLCTIGGSFTPASLCDDVGVVGAARVRLYRMAYDEAGSCEANVCSRGLVGRTCSVDSECVIGATRLAMVTQLGDDGVSELPPLRFSYTELAPTTTSSWRGLLSFPSNKVGSPDVAFIDVDADALPDLIESPQGSSTQYTRWRNLGATSNGTVTYDLPGPIGAPPQRLSTSGTSLFDATGDGITDLVYKRSTAEGDFGLRPGNGRGFFGLEEQLAVGGLNTFSPLGFEDPSLRTGDLDFDKRIDVMRIVTNASGVPTSIRARFSIEVGGVRALGAEVSCAPIPQADFTNGKTFLIDMNGDRLLDVVVVDTSTTQVDSIVYYPGTGRGGFGLNGSCVTQGAPIALAGDPVTGLFGADFENFGGFRFADLTNDGLSDLLWAGRTSLSLWVNVGGDRLRRVDLAGWTPGTDYDRCLPGCDPATSDVLQIADLNGNGTADLVHVDRETNATRYLDLVESDGVPPHLLRTIDNGLGVVTTIDYEPSTTDYLEASAPGRTPWIAKPPFPISVVARKRVRFGLDLDGAPGEDEYVTDYRYRDGYYDGIEKEFRGFSEVEKIERGDASQPTQLTRHSFHTGAPDGVDNDGDGAIDERSAKGGAEEEPLKGLLLESRRETCDDGPDGACEAVDEIFDHTLSRWEIRTLHGATGGVCSGNGTVGCCSDLDCAAPGLGGSCVAGGAAESGILPEIACEAGKSVAWAVSTGTRTAVIEKGSGPRVDLMTAKDFDAYGNEIARDEWGMVDMVSPPPFGCQLTSGVCLGLPTQLCGSDAECGAFGPCQKSSAADGGTCTASDPFAFANAPEPIDERLTTRQWAINEADWQLRCLSERVIRDALNDEEERKRTFYDDLPIGSCELGDPTRVELWLDAESRWIPRLRTTYDGFGNPIELLDANDNRRTIDHDPDFRTYPVSETIHLDNYELETTADYHEGFGQISRVTTWSEVGAGPQYRWTYDTFARLIATIAPGDSPASPTNEYSYALDPGDDGISWIESRQRETVGGGTIDRFDYVDGLGRTLFRVAEGDAPDEWVVSAAMGYGRRGSERASWYPYFTSSSGYASPSASGSRTTTTYDAVGRVVDVESPDGSREQYVYGPLSEDLYDENDVAGLTTGRFDTRREDGLGRLVEVVERPVGTALVTRYLYDARDNLVEIVDAQSNRTEAVFDSLSRLVEINGPDRGRFQLSLDDAGNIVETIDAKGQRILMTYDRANRLTSENYLDQTGDPGTDPPDVEYHYDRPAVGGAELGDGTIGFGTNTAGQLARVRDLAGEEHASYDERRRLAWSARKLNQPRSGTAAIFTTRYAYDSADRKTAIEYPDGDRIAFAHGTRGLPSSISGAGGGAVVVEGLRYEPSGQVEFLRFGNGVESSWSYDDRLRPIEVETIGAGATSGMALVHHAYEYDPYSNLVALDDLRPGVAATDPRNATQQFEYDGLHRVTRYRLGPRAPQPSLGTIDYQWDGIGNLLSKTSDLSSTVAGADIGTITYGGASGRSGRQPRLPGDDPGPHAPTGASGGERARFLVYDDNGNVTQLDNLDVTWDYKDRLVEIDGPEFRIEYVYDHADHRVATHRTWKIDTPDKKAGQTDSTYYPIRAFELKSGQARKYVFLGDRRVAASTGSLDDGSRRIQRLELFPGWNLIAVHVDATDTEQRLRNLGIAEIFRWESSEKRFVPVLEGTIPTGSVLWVHAPSPVSTALVGERSPASAPTTESGDFFATSDASSVFLEAALPSGAEAWLWDAEQGRWRISLEAPIDGLSDAEGILRPGEPAFVRGAAISGLTPPPASANLRFFHADRLQSTRVVTDGAGRIVEERDYLPFGSERFRLRGDDFGLDANRYSFQDRESQEGTGLYHMTRRFYLSDLGSFVSVDPKRLVPAAKRAPRVRNAYAYGNANPIAYVDSAGLEGRWFSGSAGVKAEATKGSKTTGVEVEAHVYEDSVGDTIRLTGIIGKVEAGASLGAGTAKVSYEAAVMKTEISAKLVEGVRASAFAGLGAGFEAGIDSSRGKRIAKVEGWALVGAKVEVDLAGVGVLDAIPENSPIRAKMDGFRRAMVQGASVAVANEESRLAAERGDRADRERRRIHETFDRHVRRTQLEEFRDEILGSQEGYEEWLWLQEQGYDPDFSGE